MLRLFTSQPRQQLRMKDQEDPTDDNSFDQVKRNNTSVRENVETRLPRQQKDRIKT